MVKYKNSKNKLKYGILKEEGLIAVKIVGPEEI